VSGDRYAGIWPAEAFAKQDIIYEPSAAPKSDLYRDCLPLLNSGRIELPDLPRLHAQFPLPGTPHGPRRKDSIDHAPGGHDDLANAVAGAAIEAARGVGTDTIMAATWPRRRASGSTSTSSVSPDGHTPDVATGATTCRRDRPVVIRP
jgi:hypothetical protein